MAPNPVEGRPSRKSDQRLHASCHASCSSRRLPGRDIPSDETPAHVDGTLEEMGAGMVQEGF